VENSLEKFLAFLANPLYAASIALDK
jgi:hypothetical protein